MIDDLELGNILQEIKNKEKDPHVISFLEEYLEAEKSFGYSFKDPIRELLTKHISEGE